MTALSTLTSAAWDVDFHQALRRLQCAFPDAPRAGVARTPRAEPVRLGQDPSLAFAPAAITSFQAPAHDRPGRLRVAFFGLFGPHGPLPHHVTALARERARNDASLSAFLDLFHHRALLLLHRSWAQSRPHVCEDRPRENHFQRYLEALAGHPDPSHRSASNASVLPRQALSRHGALFVPRVRSKLGLEALLREQFQCPARIGEFMPEWLSVPDAQRWRLGAREAAALGRSTTVGSRAFSRSERFRIELGPMSWQTFTSLLPGTPALERLKRWVRAYVRAPLSWDLRLSLRPEERPELRLGRTFARLGYQSWLGSSRGTPPGLVLDPQRARCSPGRASERVRDRNDESAPAAPERSLAGQAPRKQAPRKIAVSTRPGGVDDCSE